jgi:hypothetical protein
MLAVTDRYDRTAPSQSASHRHPTPRQADYQDVFAIYIHVGDQLLAVSSQLSIVPLSFTSGFAASL